MSAKTIFWLGLTGLFLMFLGLLTPRRGFTWRYVTLLMGAVAYLLALSLRGCLELVQ